MKRAIGLILAAVVCIVAFLSVRGSLPFMPIYGRSMEPALHSGALLTIKYIAPGDVRVGDIIVYTVPVMVRNYYNYPPTVAHRVIQVNTVPTLSFRTKGDNTGEDPFTIRPQDIRGTVGKQISYLGLPLLFFQSRQGLIFAIIAIVLLAIFLYGSELSRGGGWLHRGIFSPVISEEKRANRMLTRKIEATEHKVDATEQALVQFSGAISEYAKHLASHTSAIQGLAEASDELKNGAAEQNRVLSAIMDNVVNTARKQEPTISKTEAPPPAPPNPAAKEAKTYREIHELAGQSFTAPKPKTAEVKMIHVAPEFTRHHPVTPKPVTAEWKPANPALEPARQSPAAPKPITKKQFHTVPELSRQPLPAGCARVQPPKPTTEEILERLRKIRNQL